MQTISASSKQLVSAPGVSHFVNELKTEPFTYRRTLRVKLTPSFKENAKNVSKLRDNAF